MTITPLPNLFLAMVFLSSALLRLLNKKAREEERAKVFFFPKYADYVIIGFELIAGILLLLNYKIILYYLFAFIAIACTLVVFYHYKAIVASTKDVMTFKPTATSLLLHLTYLFIILYT